MNILDAIVEHKRMEVLKRRRKKGLVELQESPHYLRQGNQIDMEGLRGKPGIIAEFKRKSPSRGMINETASPVSVAEGYERAGVSAMSVLTDRNFFGGSFKDLRDVREAHGRLPLLRKDFIIDSYQLHEARAYGADLVLLIAAILDRGEVADLAAEARSLGLEVLLEVHREAELEKYHPDITYLGVNNRDLTTFRVDTATSLDMIGKMPSGVVPVSESGLSDPAEIGKLHRAGFRLFLVGEAFMNQLDPGMACRVFIDQIRGDD